MDDQSRYTTARLRREVDEAKRLARLHALEEAARAAKTWLEDWGIDLQGTSDDYREAVTSGKFSGRRIPAEMAKSFAKTFQERSDAVYDCGEHVHSAIMALAVKETA